MFESMSLSDLRAWRARVQTRLEKAQEATTYEIGTRGLSRDVRALFDQLREIDRAIFLRENDGIIEAAFPDHD